MIRILFLLCLILNIRLYAQNEKKDLRKGKEHFEYEEYRKGLPYLENAYKINPDNLETCYYLGKTYYIIGKKEKCLPLFEKIYKTNPNFKPDVTEYYAYTLHFEMKFDEAMKIYAKLRDQYKPTSKEFFAYEKLISQCKNGKELIKKPVEVIIENAGAEINTEYPDFAPVVTADDEEMIFTSRRPDCLGDIAPDGFHYEDLYIATKKDGKWTKGINMGTSINTTGHDASIALSADGSKLYIYRDVNGGDIYYSTLKGNKWSEPKNIGKPINSNDYEPSVCISADGKWLFFVSNRPGGKGGRDIYLCEMGKNGKWSEPRNLEEINTEQDDDAPFFHPDGKTLYFSSKGHSSMGGYDIFKSELKPNGKFSKPLNLGYPINTTDDDIYFVITASGRHGYYASSKAGGYGEKDIYIITFKLPEVATIETTEPNLKIEDKEAPISVVSTPSLTLLKGIVTDAQTGKPVEATLFIIDNEKNDTLYEITSNSTTGKYLVTLPAGKNYGIVAQAPNYLFHSENFDIAQNTTYQEVQKDIQLKAIKKGEKIILKNIFFDFDKATLRKESIAELERLHKILTDNPKIKIKIGGHTDNVGSDAYNQQLSEKRAKAVVDWLIQHGIDASRLQYQGYGESVPIATNETDEGRQLNRRTEFEIID
jgi:outer membrane protein OmpA-like peptidoglycan-associated protein